MSAHTLPALRLLGFQPLTHAPVVIGSANPTKCGQYAGHAAGYGCAPPLERTMNDGLNGEIWLLRLSEP